ncbi:nucleotidyltransferase family protein [Winogradskyella vincentii]|uniref:Nucleotidyltransferase family protein n=1 Tax=Winogradskyella vincentii TaxID=2877122 RepID=A0ABS7Y2U3_9FLAO|nr:nucleotidyltransferase family protein [Winogradskyella vincentii]MCA0154241.1 nucleotidyltransferase family protein [Winogradskyella vincentii]
MKTAILILAAGNSRRMGTPKQLLKHGDTTMLGQVINNSLKSRASSVHVVLGAHANLIRPNLPKNISVIINKEFEKGLSSSIIKGVTELQHYDSVIIALGDQPLVTSNYFNELIELCIKKPNKIIASKYEKHNGVPAIFPSQFYSELLNLKGDTGAKSLLNSNYQLVQVIETPVNLFDVDTPHDYELLNKN